jgi:diguanylate cyclase
MVAKDAKVEEWKEKFFKVSEALEKQQHYEQLLERSLNRLAFAAKGFDPVLDKTLSTLLELLRDKNRNTNQIEAVLVELERSIAQMDQNAARQSGIADSLGRLLAQIKWPKQNQKDATQLARKVRKSSENELPALIEQTAHLIQDSFIGVETQEPGGLLSRLFGGGRDKNVAQKNGSRPERVTDKSENTLSVSPVEILITLLEQLSLPKEFNEQAIKIRDSIQQGITISELPRVIDDIAKLVSQLGASAVYEKREYEAFLLNLTDKLSSLDQQLNRFEQDELSVYTQRQALGHNVKEEMKGLRLDVQDATELSQLRESVSTRLDILNRHISHAHQVDRDRFAEAQEQIKQLNQRLHTMESEAEILRQATIKAQEEALKDALTGIWNRQALNDTVESEYARWQRHQKPLTMVIWDVDHFKSINDQYGHSAGDVVLKAIAQIFKKTVRKADFMARFGGEEFVGLFPDTDLDSALKLSNKIRQILEKTHFYYQDITVPVTTSAGLAMFEQGDSIEDVFNRADKALYQAKNNGRNNCVSLLKQQD